VVGKGDVVKARFILSNAETQEIIDDTMFDTGDVR
jgi:hypothetical protein